MSTHTRILKLAFLVALFLTAVWLYLPPYHNAFLGDDYKHLQYINAFLDAPWRAVRIFHPFWLGWYYRPLQTGLIFLERLAFGYDPVGYYVFQTGLHALVVALLYRVGRSWRLGLFPALSATALFAIRSHHQDVVGWISSAANLLVALFSLLAVWGYLAYRRRPSHQRMLLVIGPTLLALLSHEEGVLLLPFLVLIRLTERPRRRLRRDEWALFGGLTVMTAVFIIIQLVRPNWTINIGQVNWLDLFSLHEISQFIVRIFLSLTLLPAARFDPLFRLPGGMSLMAAAILALTGLWFWRSGRWPDGRAVRLGLLWTSLHLGFIYATLWLNRPDFFGGRHLYVAGLGLAWAVGGSLTAVPPLPYNSRRATRLLLAAAIVANLTFHAGRTIELAARRAKFLHEITVFETTLKTALPSITSQTAIYVNGAPIGATFIAPAVSAWYEQPIPFPHPGGDLAALGGLRRATPDVYVFDYAEGTAVNLFPLLQETDETIFLWDAADHVAPVGPGGDRRLGLAQRPTDPNYSHAVSIPRRADLAFAIRPDGKPVTFRVRLETNGEEVILFEKMLGVKDAEKWTAVALPLTAYWDREATIILETAGGPGYWAHPALVRGRRPRSPLREESNQPRQGFVDRVRIGEISAHVSA